MDDNAYRQSLESKIRNRSKGLGVHANIVRRQETLKRFLIRLAALDLNWYLKGALILEARIALADKSVSAKTMDADIGALRTADLLLNQIRDATVLKPDDRFIYRIDKVAQGLADGADYRVYIDVQLDGRHWDRFKLDISDDRYMSGVDIEDLSLGQDLAGMDLGVVRAQPIEYALAEKLDAYTKRELEYSSRERDLYDMVYLAELATEKQLEAGVVRQALEAVFAGVSRPVPKRLREPPEHWPDKSSVRSGMVQSKQEAFERAERFWNPILGESLPGC